MRLANESGTDVDESGTIANESGTAAAAYIPQNLKKWDKFA